MARFVVADVIICSMIFGTLGFMYLMASYLRFLLGGDHSPLTLSQLIDQHAIEYGWLLKLLVNCFGYGCVILPGILIYQYTKRIDYLADGRSGCITTAVKFCLTGIDAERLDAGGTIKQLLAASATNEVVLYAYCFVGLMGSYLTWGLLQEKIITQEYVDSDGKKAMFRDSQFLVFVNRALALVVSAVYLLVKQQPRHRAPLYKYSYASFSNIMSAWFQYEALKFVSFPSQVLAKSCKIIPVMLMGKVVSRTKYEFYEYLTAGLISIGMVFFLTGSADGSTRSSITTMTGVLLLTLYMVFDSFTANWQSDLFKSYQMSAIQMMCGVSLFSTLFTLASLCIQGGLLESLVFGMDHPKFIVDCIILSISSSVGQLFIYFTISKFGAVGFTIIMTIRQGVAIMLSCIVYGHHISGAGVFGVMIVFGAIFIRVYCSHRLKAIRRKTELNRAQRIGV